MQQRRKTIARRGFYVLLTLALLTWMAIHFTVIAFHLLPSNALTLLHPEFVSTYVRPFFVQRWTMFAPTPPTTNMQLIIQLRLMSKQDGQMHLTEWFDVVGKLRAKTWVNPFAPEVTRGRTIRGVLGHYKVMALTRQQVPEFESTPVAEQAERTFNRLLVVLADELYDPEQFQLEAVRALAVIVEIPPFSESQTPDYEPKTLAQDVSDWFPRDDREAPR
jgi:hypothetical protein